MSDHGDLARTKEIVRGLQEARGEENLVASAVAWHILQKKEKFPLWILLFGLYFFFTGTESIVLWGPALLYALAAWLRSQRALRIHRYISTILPESVATVKDLALSVGKKEETVVKDLRWGISQRIFPEGYLVEDSQLFLLDRQTFSLYRKLHKTPLEKKTDPVLEDRTAPSQEERKEEDPCAKILSHLEVLEGDLDPQDGKILRRIIGLGEVIVAQREKANPAAYVHFEEQYLPTAKKLAEGARDLAWQETSSAKESLEEIRRGLLVVEKAFRTMVEDIHSEVGSDAKRDLRSLEMMMKRDGLMEDHPFEKGRDDA